MCIRDRDKITRKRKRSIQVYDQSFYIASRGRKLQGVYNAQDELVAKIYKRGRELVLVNDGIKLRRTYSRKWFQPIKLHFLDESEEIVLSTICTTSGKYEFDLAAEADPKNALLMALSLKDLVEKREREERANEIDCP